MEFVKAENLVFEYYRRDEHGNVTEIKTALKNINISIEKGDFVAVLGHNGSGKSTFAKHLNVLLKPVEGSLWIRGFDAGIDENISDIRNYVGMVFQNPDNQIVSSIVEEDVAFGPENMGVPSPIIRQRVDEALDKMHMREYTTHASDKLSGGQKQKIAIAGVLAMKPECIVLDEPTAMIDPAGRLEILRHIIELNRQEGITIIYITHYMEEVIYANQVYVMEEGEVVLKGKPREIFTKDAELRRYHLDVPPMTNIANLLRKRGLPIAKNILTVKEMVKAILLIGEKYNWQIPIKPMEQYASPIVTEEPKDDRLLMIINHIDYYYNKGYVYEKKALHDIQLTIGKNEIIGIIGQTGSGKSTLVQHLNGLIRANAGEIYYRGCNIYDEDFQIKKLRQKVGLVFQYAENQLFESTVYKDICFGPRNQGCSDEEIDDRVYEAMESMGIDVDILETSPFHLSGGQKRRVAIAGILAMQPEILILDEPTAGLDPKGRDELLHLILRLKQERGITVVFVSHCMEDIAEYVDRLIVMEQGRIVLDDSPHQVFKQMDLLKSIGLSVPQVTFLLHELKNQGERVSSEKFSKQVLSVDCITQDEAVSQICKLFSVQ